MELPQLRDKILVSIPLDLLLINKQTGGKKEKKQEGGGEQDLWTMCSENEARHSPAQV